MGIGPERVVPCGVFPRSCPLLHRGADRVPPRLVARIHEFPARTNGGRNPCRAWFGGHEQPALSTGLSTVVDNLGTILGTRNFP